MAMSKFADARIIHPAISKTQWANIRVAGKGVRVVTGNDLNGNLIERASELMKVPFDPTKFLLTHATIIASVDVQTPPGIKTGSVLVDGFKVNRRYGNFSISPETDKYINNNCFVPGTPITMADGTCKPIEQVQVGDLVLTHKGRARRVLETFVHDTEGLLYGVEVRGTNERLYVTGEHPFFVFRPNRVCVECGQPIEHKVQAVSHLIGKHYCSKECYYKKKVSNAVLLRDKVGEFAPVKDLGYGDFASTPIFQGNESVNLTLGQARLVGLFLAEGCYELNSRDNNARVGVCWSFHQKERGTLAQMVCDLMRSEFGSDCVIRDVSGTQGITVTTRTDRKAVEFFSYWVQGVGSTTKTLHPSLIHAPRDIQLEVVRGWLDGDGSAFDTAKDSDETPGDFRVVGSTASQSLASQMMLMFHRLGIAPRLNHAEVPGRQRLIVDGAVRVVSDPSKTSHIWNLSCGACWVQELIETTRFEDAYQKAMTSRGGVQAAPALRFLNGYALQMITSVTPVEYTGKVFNFETEEDHSYIAGGIAVHNSDAWSRGVLAKAYHTFVGGHNFVEHVQVEELSKGRIIDAVARDVGDSMYVDILIATDLQHDALVRSIRAGEMSTLSMGCFLPGTQVSLADGRRIAIEDVQPGDFVLTHKGRAREVLNKQIRGGVWGIRRINAVGIPTAIEATDNHPFYVFRQSDVCACGCGGTLPVYKNGRKNATRGLTRRFLRGHDKRIFNPNNTYSLDEARERKTRLASLQQEVGCWVRADELRVGDFLCFPRVQEVGLEVSTGRARLLGYFLAEGSFLKRQGIPVETQFSFSLTEKDTFAAEVVTLLKQEFPGNDPWVQDRPDRNTCTVHISGKDTAAWFKAHGGEYSNGKRLSPDVMGWTTEGHKHLIGAWLNGDGFAANQYSNQSTSGVTTSYDLACQMHLLMARCGWFARMECKVGAQTVDLQEVVNGGFVRDEVCGRLPSFNLVVGKVAAQTMSPYTVKVALDSGFQTQGPRVRDDMTLFPVTSVVSDTYEGWVHNMEVAEDNSYVVSGICSHNCTVDGTICSKCGHWAADETEMCPHIKYMKGNTFYDEQGRRHRIAELCGHESLDPTGGVNFMEASWVGTPAFTGAVLRNVLEPTEAELKKAAVVLSSPPPQWSADANVKAASEGLIIPKRFASPGRQDVSQDPFTNAFKKGMDAFLAGWEDEVEGGGMDTGDAGGAEAPAAEANPVDDMVKRLEDYATKEVERRIRDRIQKQEAPGNVPPADSSMNETLMKQATVRRYLTGLNVLVRTAASDAHLVDSLAWYNQQAGIDIPVQVYRAALSVGATSAYKTVEEFHVACDKALGRKASLSEVKTMVRIGKLLTRRGSLSGAPVNGSRQGGL